MFLADTNVISEPRQLRPDPRVMQWLREHESELFISAVTLGELQSGISLLADGAKKAALKEWFDNLRRRYRGAILAFDEPAAILWGNLNADLLRGGRKLPARDSFLAATARCHELAIATRNERDFAGTGIKTVNPWTSATGIG